MDDATVTSELLEVQVPLVKIVFEVEHLDFNVPRIILNPSLAASVKNWSTRVRNIAPHPVVITTLLTHGSDTLF